MYEVSNLGRQVPSVQGKAAAARTTAQVLSNQTDYLTYLGTYTYQRPKALAAWWAVVRVNFCSVHSDLLRPRSP